MGTTFARIIQPVKPVLQTEGTAVGALLDSRVRTVKLVRLKHPGYFFGSCIYSFFVLVLLHYKL